MTALLQYAILIMTLVSAVLLIIMLIRVRGLGSSTGLESRIDSLERQLERQERLLREELALSREEAQQSARQGREESTIAVSAFGDSLMKRMSEIARISLSSSADANSALFRQLFNVFRRMAKAALTTLLNVSLSPIATRGSVNGMKLSTAESTFGLG